MAALAGATQQTDASGYKSKSVMVDRATGNALTLKDGKYYNADGTLHKGAKYSRVISSLAEKQIQKTATSFEKNLLADIAPVKGYTGPKSTNPSVSKGSGGGGNKGKSDPKENSTIDWISRSAELLERKSEELKTAISIHGLHIQDYQKKISNVYRSCSLFHLILTQMKRRNF